MKKRGFSLMEMMIVLLIVAIIAAASAPMVSKKMMRDADGGSPWIYAGLGGSITYNPDGNGDKTAMIGTSNRPSGAGKSKLYIETSSSEPHISFKKSGADGIFQLGASVTSVSLTNNLSDQGASSTTAMGYKAKAVGDSSTAMGTSANATGINAVAIGRNAKTTGSNQIMLGTSSDTVVVPGNLDLSKINGTLTLGSSTATVYIPGKLVVEGDTELAKTSGKYVYIGAAQNNNKK